MDNEKIQQFMWFDLVLLSLLAAISEWMGNAFLPLWGSGFYYSFSIVIGLIAMIRWGAAGVTVSVIGGIPGMFFSHMTFGSGLYVMSNLFLGIPVLLYGQKNRDRIAGSMVFLASYVLLSHISLSAGKGMIIFLLTGERTGAIDYFGATFLILVINVIVCLVLRTRKGLICDMRYYFARREGEGNEKHSY